MRNRILVVVMILLVGAAIFIGLTIFFGDNDRDQTSGKVFISFPERKDDQDMDGVLDADEKKFNTSTSTVDTDGDGLTDKIEIEKLKTDPTKLDTDGDGVTDGLEIVKGSDPLKK